MGGLLLSAENKDKLDKAIAEETRRLYFQGLGFSVAFKKAKELYKKEPLQD